MAPASNFITALNAGDQTPGDVSYTAIYSTLVDELITPNATAARLKGASNLELQALCPARVVTHVTILADAVAFSLVLDALRFPGPASAARFNRATCLRTTTIGVPGALSGLQTLLFPPLPVLGAVPATEPPLQPYTQPAPAPDRAALRTRPATPPRATATVTAGPARTSASVGVPAPAAAPEVAPVTAASTQRAAAFPARPAATTNPAGDRGVGRLVLLAALVLGAGTAGGMAARRLRRS